MHFLSHDGISCTIPLATSAMSTTEAKPRLLRRPPPLRDPRASARHEPRITAIAELVSALLDMVDLEVSGSVVQVDSFRLRAEEDWRTMREASLLTNLGSLSAVCNLHCEFCYEIDRPVESVSKRQPFISIAEAAARTRSYGGGRGLFREYAPLLEVFVNPDLFPILRLVRERDPDTLIDLTTNGSRLTPEVVQQLAELNPVCVALSLNSADPEIRRELMGDRKPEIAIEAPRLLREYGVPYVGSIVAWPTVPLSDIERTVRYFDANDAHFIRVCLPGAGAEHFRRGHVITDDDWMRVTEHIKKLRRLVSTPVIQSPYSFPTSHVLPIVEGVVRNSPAALAGLQIDDEILQVDGRPVVSRAHAVTLLRRAGKRESVELEVARAGQKVVLTLAQLKKDEVPAYPYWPLGWRVPSFPAHPWGVLLPDSLQLKPFKLIYERVREIGARKAVCLTSRLLYPLVSDLFSRLPRDENMTIEALLVENRYFGGNICMGDLWMVSDISHAIQTYVAANGKPDVIFVPSSFLTEWKRDLLGNPFSEVAAKLGVQIELVKCNQFVL